MITEKQKLAIRHAVLSKHPRGGHSLARDIDREQSKIRQSLNTDKDSVRAKIFDILKSCPPCSYRDWGKHVTELSKAEAKCIVKELRALALSYDEKFQGGHWVDIRRHQGKMYTLSAKLYPFYLANDRERWWKEVMQKDPQKVLDLCDEWLASD